MTAQFCEPGLIFLYIFFLFHYFCIFLFYFLHIPIYYTYIYFITFVFLCLTIEKYTLQTLRPVIPQLLLKPSAPTITLHGTNKVTVETPSLRLSRLDVTIAIDLGFYVVTHPGLVLTPILAVTAGYKLLTRAGTRW